MAKFIIREQNLGATFVYVISTEQEQHCEKLGLAGCPCVKSFIGRTPAGLKLARKRAEELCNNLNSK